MKKKKESIKSIKVSLTVNVDRKNLEGAKKRLSKRGPLKGRGGLLSGEINKLLLKIK